MTAIMQVAKRTPGKTRSAFVCPDCRSSLHDLTCDCCQVRYEIVEGIPNLLSRDGRFKSARSIGSVYDYIYSHRRSVWEDQGRTPEFIEYFAALAAARSTGRILEIGCGEGILLARLQAREKLAVDISAKALQLARSRSGAECAAALAERLPFADSEFDAVFSVGVMEHFLDENAACAEIRRVLKPRGAYIALIHTARTRAQELQQKIREYLFPRPRPLALAKWLLTKVYRPIHQPILPASIRTKDRWSASDRPQYLAGLLYAVDQARHEGREAIAAIEFGVADGHGLLALQVHAAAVERETGCG